MLVELWLRKRYLCHCHFRIDGDHTRREDAWLLAHPHIRLVGATSRRSRIVTERSTGLAAVKKRAGRQSFRDGERKLAMTVVNKTTEPVTRQAVLVITFTPFPTVINLSERQIWEVLTNRTCGTQPMTKLNMKQ